MELKWFAWLHSEVGHEMCYVVAMDNIPEYTVNSEVLIYLYFLLQVMPSHLDPYKYIDDYLSHSSDVQDNSVELAKTPS